MEKVKHELKPCPFCGSIEDVEFTPASISGHFATPPSIGCLKCAYTVYGATTFYGNDEEEMMKFSDNLLINWWNRRSYEKSNRQHPRVEVGNRRRCEQMIDEWKKGAKYWDKPWNPVVGCLKVSEGCANCYAERICSRFGQWKHKDFQPKPGNCGKPPKNGVVFVGNMTDIFGEWNSDATILNWLNMLNLNAKNLILTKRTDRMASFWMRNSFRMKSYPLFGMTAENQHNLEQRYSFFCRIVETRWLSIEPMLERMDLFVLDSDNDRIIDGIDWVVVGAESGPNRRPCKIEWVRDIVKQCREANVPVFVKQLDIDGKLVEDIEKFPEDLQIRQVPWKM